MLLSRRLALGLAGAASLPRFASGQADNRPSLTIAVQKISTSNTLEPMREQSNVGQRIFYTFAETLTDHAWTGDLSLRPGLAESFRRIDGRTLELKLRQNVRFHNGDGMTAEDVASSFGRMEIVDKYTVAFVNKVPDATLEGRLTRNTGVIFSQRAFAEAATWLD